MCDTLVAMPSVTKDGSVLFAKNSDRDPNEAHEVVLIPAAEHVPGSMLKATYIGIPQVSHTFGVLLCKPFWIWGAEMGANEHGVVIGNEAIFSKVSAGKTPGLIGMDYLRLGLERGKSAEEALKVIIDVLEQYGQSGNCGYDHPMYYHNSFIIADSQSAFVLETVGREWAVENVKDLRSISNQISITDRFDSVSEGLVEQAVQRQWCRNASDFNFHRDYSDLIFTKFSDAQRRSCESMEGMMQDRGTISEETMFSLLRSHRGVVPSTSAIAGADVCMHAGYGPIRGSQTTGSMVARLTPDGATYWVTGTSAPCTSIFKPVWFEAGLPRMGEPVSGEFNPKTLWWQHEVLHRKIMQNYVARIQLIRGEREEFEQEVVQQVREFSGKSAEEKFAFSQKVVNEAELLEKKWLELVKNTSSKNTAFPLYRRAWKQHNQKAGMNL